MENPLHWTRIERIIHEALNEAARQREAGVCGYSTEMIVANALRREGVIPDERATSD